MSNRGRHKKSSKNKKPTFNRISINVYNEIKKCIEHYYFSNNNGIISWQIVDDISKNQNYI